MVEKNNNLWCYDVEVYRNLFCVTFYNHITLDKKVFEISLRKNEYLDLESFILNTKDLWLCGYNNSNYDDLIISWLTINSKKYNNYLDLCYNLWLFSNDIIQKTGLNRLSKYKYHNLFNTINLQKVLYLDKVPYKSLKACAVNLKWPKIQDLPIPFDSEIKEEQIDLILEYNENDVLITNRLREYSNEILTLRKDLSKFYGLNLMNESNSSICNKILEKEYSIISGLSLEDFKDKRTIRENIHISDILFYGNIKFKSSSLNNFLKEIARKTIKVGESSKEGDGKSNELGKITIGSTTHVVGLGGLHSETKPSIYNQTIDEKERLNKILTCDVVSYYPSNIINNNIYPNHLNNRIVEVINNIKNKRLEAKKNKRVSESEGLKIVINSFFGKFLSKFSWLYDPLAAYRVTINCQFFLLMLIEDLENYGIKVISSNTDGIECIVNESKIGLYYDILGNWQNKTGFELEVGEYKSLIFRDINCYYAISETKDRVSGIVTRKVKEKGDFETEKTINKSTDFAIIYKALKEYFVNEIPIEETILSSEDILDFCASQKVGGEMKAELHIFDKYGKSSIESLQKTNRYFISEEGGYIFKRKKIAKKEDNSNQISIFDLEEVEKEQLISMIANEKVTILNMVTDLQKML